MDARTQLIISEFKRASQSLYGSRLNRIVLFGSYARNEHHDDSDIDFMVVLNDAAITRLDEINRFLPVQSALSLKHNITISVLPVSYKKYSQSTLPVYHFARLEGITV
ncbi:MAG: nucleotidyltransferase domain-containing protein [Bacteroidetes bacterium]|nr:nucleotidyltransferase domain-containing protein [Fibrella sp.]